MRAIAINVGANTNEPGFRGPLYPDGSFEYVPIPESEPTAEPVATYGDLDLETDVSAVADVPVHYDPTFPEFRGETYTYGDDYAVKAGPLSDLSAGDYVFFYATLSPTGEDRPEWAAPSWGAYLIGQFRLARDPLTGGEYRELPVDERRAFAENAHVKRETMDARVLLAGDPDESALYETAVPLSSATAGSDANRLVTELSGDSGAGPWWRRPLRFDEAATEEVLALRERRAFGECFTDGYQG